MVLLLIVSNRRDICTKFYKYFTNFANNLSGLKYENIKPSDYNLFLSNHVKCTIFFSTITGDEVLKIIIKIDNHKCNDSRHLT